MKLVIVGCESFNYNPKDKVTGVRDKSVTVSAINLHCVGRNLKTSGLFTESIYIDNVNQTVLYDFIFDVLGSTCKDICNWVVDVDRNSSGYIDDISPVDHFDSFPDLAAIFAIDKSK